MLDAYVFFVQHTFPAIIAGWDAGLYQIDRKHLNENLRGWAANRLEKQ